MQSDGNRKAEQPLADSKPDRPEGPAPPSRRRLRPAGGYCRTASFQTATIIYDATYWFCEKFLDSRSRTVDQMIQAARSGRQNIAEGSRAGATSSKSELHLMNVARASLEELLLDFEDYLRHRRLPMWAVDSPEARAVRAVAKSLRATDRVDQSDQSDLTDADRWARYTDWLDHPDPGVRANTILCLIHQANYLLDQQLTARERAFIEDGGYSEQLATARLAERERRRQVTSESSDRADLRSTMPSCPICNRAMVLRTARSGSSAGRQFLGCTGYPECKAVVEI
jgi:restriction system protein